MASLPYGSVVTDWAGRDPGRVVLVCEGDELTVGELERRANRLARVYAERGVSPGDFVTLVLPSGFDYFVSCLAAWKQGAVPNPLSARLPRAELEAVIGRADPALIVGVEAGDWPGRETLPAGYRPPPELSDAPLPPVTPPHERAMASGGSTGVPKLIVARNPAVYDPERASALFKAKHAALVPGPLYHAVPFSASWQGIFAGCKVVVMRRFDASRCLELIERHRVDRIAFVPTMMHRIWRLPEAERKSRDVSSLEFVLTGGAPCPAWLMRAFIDWLGPQVMHEAFGPSERIGGTFITGTEWLAHPGSVGRPTAGGKLRILSPEGEDLPTGEVGEIWMLPAGGQGSTYRYIGAEARANAEGWESVGDMGRLDADGYLYLADRRSDMILCGGRNIYPAEIEAALDAHPRVRSSAVIGLPDEDLGSRVHAIVESDGPLPDEELRAHLKELLVHYKIPRSFERVDRPLRDEAGKVRRSALREARLER